MRAAAPMPGTGGMRAFWLRQFRLWHWVSAAVGLTGMLLFALTGLMLNHAGLFPARPVTVEETVALPPDLLPVLAAMPEAAEAPLPPELAAWLTTRFRVALVGRATETDAAEVYVALPVPGGDGWLAIDRDTGEVTHRHTDLGWVAFLNDLHKGRNAGPVWGLFIDLLAVACVVFTVSGLGLLWLHARVRPATWPLTWAGALLPLLVALLFVH